MRTPPERNPNQLFNNADSYGMRFDEEWKLKMLQCSSTGLSREQVLEEVLLSLADHPFALSQPLVARQVAEFRLRLLGL